MYRRVVLWDNNHDGQNGNNNYRGITVNSYLPKLFSLLLNNGLLNKMTFLRTIK